MSTTIMSNAITGGTRRLSTLGGIWGLGYSADILTGMANDGYDTSVLNTLQTAGATDAQMQILWDNYGAGTQEFAVAANQLLSSLTGGPGGAASAPGYPQAAQPKVISTGFGIFDLAQQAGWDALAVQISIVQQLIQQVAAANPGAPDVVSNVGQFNSYVAQFAQYYSQATGKGLSPLPLASISSGTLSGLGIFGIDDAVIVIVLGIVAGIYAIYQWATAKKAQAAAVQSTAQVQTAGIAAAQTQATSLNSQAATLIAQAAALPVAQATQAAALRSQAAQLQSQANALLTTAITPASPTTNWNVWLQQNIGMLVVALAAIVIVPPLLRRR